MKNDLHLYSLLDKGMTEEEFMAYVRNNVPITELIRQLYELYLKYKEKRTPPIRITMAEFRKHFKIKGIRPDGTPENRGSKRWPSQKVKL